MAQFKVNFFQLFSYTAPLPVNWEKEAGHPNISPGNNHLNVSSVSSHLKEESGYIKRSIEIIFSTAKLNRDDENKKIFLYADKNLVNTKDAPEWMELKVNTGYAFPMEKEREGIDLKFHQLFNIIGKLPRGWEEELSAVGNLKLSSKGEKIIDAKVTKLERRGKEIERTVECTFHSDIIFDDARLLIIQNEIEGLYDSPDYLEHCVTTPIDQMMDYEPDELGFYSYEINFIQMFDIIGVPPKHWEESFQDTTVFRSQSNDFIIEQVRISQIRKENKRIFREIDITVKSRSSDTADVGNEAVECITGFYETPDYAASGELITQSIIPFNAEPDA